MSKLMKTRGTAKTTSQIFNFVVVHPAFNCWGKLGLYHCFSLFLYVFFLQLRHKTSENPKKRQKDGKVPLPLTVSFPELFLTHCDVWINVLSLVINCMIKWNNFQPSVLFKIHGILLRSGQKPAVRLTDDVPFTARARVYLNVHLNIIKQEITCSISPAMAIESGVCGLICPLTWNSNPIRPLFPASRLPALKTHLPCF